VGERKQETWGHIAGLEEGFELRDAALEVGGGMVLRMEGTKDGGSMRRLRGRSALIMYLPLIIMCSWLGVVAHDLPCPANNQMLLACIRSCPRFRVCKGLETRGVPRAAGMREKCCRPWRICMLDCCMLDWPAPSQQWSGLQQRNMLTTRQRCRTGQVQAAGDDEGRR
jgi:hypothetical protein